MSVVGKRKSGKETSKRACHEEESILLFDNDYAFLSKAKTDLKLGGFMRLDVAETLPAARKYSGMTSYEMVIVGACFDGDEDEEDGIDFVNWLRLGGYKGIAALVSMDASFAQVLRAVRAGANSYLVKGALNLTKEVRSLLNGNGHSVKDRTKVDAKMSANVGFLRSCGLTKRDIEILCEFCNSGFARYEIMASQLNIPVVQVRKRFSRIYSKLGICDRTQLSHLLTLCQMLEWNSVR